MTPLDARPDALVLVLSLLCAILGAGFLTETIRPWRRRLWAMAALVGLAIFIALLCALGADARPS